MYVRVWNFRSSSERNLLEGVLMYVYMFVSLMHDIVVSSICCVDMHGMSPNRFI